MDLGKLSELSEKRTCKECGAEFQSDPGKEGETALQKFVDHSVMHQPEPKQWTEAYNKIQAGRQKSR